MVLLYPLRAIFVHEAYRPVTAHLEGGGWAPLERMAGAAPRIPPRDIEFFLHSLQRKGFVEQKGFFPLEDAECPTVSVIVPVRNRPEDIDACLRSLERLDYPSDRREVIVVDDASDDGTPEVAERFAGVRLLRMNRRRQAAFCRNRAAEVARGEILAFIDSDCTADPTWLRELVPAFRDPSLGALGGWVDAAFDRNGLDRYEKVKSALKMGAWCKRSEQAERFFYVPACNFLVRRNAFAAVGGFRECLHVGEDVDFCWRLQDTGRFLEFRPVGRVSHKHRNRLGAFCARRFDYGTSEPVLQGLHGGRVKTLYLPWTESLFWLLAALGAVLGTLAPLAPAAGLFLVDAHRRYGRLAARRVPVRRPDVLAAVARSYLAFVHHCCSFVSRYYLVAVPAAALVSPTAAAVMAGMHLIAGGVEYVVKKPRLNPASFLFYFTLEQVSYQCGVWWECIRRIDFRPVLPRIVHKRI